MSENELQVIDEREIFGKEFKIYGTAENPLFLAKQIAELIDYSFKDSRKIHRDVSKMLSSVDEGKKLKSTLKLGGKDYCHGGVRKNTEIWFLTEDGLYEVLMQSRKPIAKQFKKEIKNILSEMKTIKKEIKIKNLFPNENELQVFTNDEFGSIRAILIDKEIYFVGSDITTVLGHSNASSAISNYCKNIMKREAKVGKCKTRVLLIQSEDVAALIQKSKIMPAKDKEKFKEWLFNLFDIKDDLIVIESREEIEFFDKLENMFNTMNIPKGIKQYNVLDKYRIDYYIPELKIAIEYDENGHSGYTYEQHEGRQEEIQNELCCEFVRLDNRDDIFTNIAKVFKVILDKSINKCA